MRKFIVLTILVTFMGSSIQAPVFAQMSLPWMPMPGVRVGLSPDFTPAVLKGITIHPENPLMFDFIIYKGDEVLSNEQKQEEYEKLVKYFLASLAIPDEDQWVNLSPYEKNRIIQDDFGKTLMGHDLLSQDYILKQITASLIDPEENLGKRFWERVYAKAQQQYGTTNIPVNTFNKVWILPDQALVYEKGNAAYVLKSHLKVMLEEDYLSLAKHSAINTTKAHTIGSQVVREIVLPALEKEVNEGKNFAMLRQVYSGMILAAWFKRTLKKSILGQIYTDKSRVKGVDQDPKNNESIYQQYLRAYKKGVFNFIKDDADRYTHETLPRKYFSGGFVDKAQAILEIDRNAADGKLIMAKQMSRLDDAMVVLNQAGAARTEQLHSAAMTTPVIEVGNAIAVQQLVAERWQKSVQQSGKPKVLNLCSANVFRSPLMEIMFHRYGIKALIGSAGTGSRDKKNYKSVVADVFSQTKGPFEKSIGKENLENLIRAIVYPEQRPRFGWSASLTEEEILMAFYRFNQDNPGENMPARILDHLGVLEGLFSAMDQKLTEYKYYRASDEVTEIAMLNDIKYRPKFVTPMDMRGADIIFVASKEQVDFIRKYLPEALDKTFYFQSLIPYLSSHSLDIPDPEKDGIGVDALYRRIEGTFTRGLLLLLQGPHPQFPNNEITISIALGSVTLTIGPQEGNDQVLQVLKINGQLLDKDIVIRPGETLSTGSSENGGLLMIANDKEYRMFGSGRVDIRQLVGKTKFGLSRRFRNVGNGSLVISSSSSNLTDIRDSYQRLVYQLLSDQKVQVNFGISSNPVEMESAAMTAEGKQNEAMAHAEVPGGIDLNSANLSMMIKRDGKGVVLPLNQRDLAQLSNIEGLDPVILSIRPASQTPVFSQVQTSP